MLQLRAQSKPILNSFLQFNTVDNGLITRTRFVLVTGCENNVCTNVTTYK